MRSGRVWNRRAGFVAKRVGQTVELHVGLGSGPEVEVMDDGCLANAYPAETVAGKAVMAHEALSR